MGCGSSDGAATLLSPSSLAPTSDGAATLLSPSSLAPTSDGDETVSSCFLVRGFGFGNSFSNKEEDIGGDGETGGTEFGFGGGGRRTDEEEANGGGGRRTDEEEANGGGRCGGPDDDVAAAAVVDAPSFEDSDCARLGVGVGWGIEEKISESENIGQSRYNERVKMKKLSKKR